MSEEELIQQLEQQAFANGYELVSGVEMHAQHGDRFQIPHPVLKKHIGVGHFVELRIDSPRFSAHPDAPDNCMCPHCNEEATKPILSHEHPASLLQVPKQNVPSRGWGEDFWVLVTERDGQLFKGRVDNPLYEERLHGVRQGQQIVLHQDHILAVHPAHRLQLVSRMDSTDLKQLAEWLGKQKE